MSVFPQAFFPLVGRHLMSFSFLSARHTVKTLLHIGFHLAHKSFGGFESRNRMLGDDDGGILGNVPGCFLGPFLHDETSKTPQVHILVVTE